MRKPRLDHIGIAVRSIEEAALLRDLGLTVEHVEIVETQKVKTAFIPVGDANIELLEPTAGDSPIAKFIEKRGEGFHHIAYAVEDIEGALSELERSGVQLIDRVPRRGAEGLLIAFLHPHSTHGVLTELCSKPESPTTHTR